MTTHGERQSLSIGEVADATGVSAASLRMWEIRYGFPAPTRLASGHRRYDVATVSMVREVVRRRDAGVRLDVAIEQAQRAAAPSDPPTGPSVFAELRRLHPWLHPQRLRKPTLVALSWAIEDEFCARALSPHLFATFQREQYWRPASARWAELARSARGAYVFADFADAGGQPDRITRVPLGELAPMRNEWSLVCDAPGQAAALSAWEVPGQAGVPERDRLFEAVWTVDPVAVRDAARVCARVVDEAGVEGAFDLELALVSPVDDTKADLAYVTAMFNRVVAYVDHLPR